MAASHTCSTAASELPPAVCTVSAVSYTHLNQEAIKRQLAKLIDFDSDAPNAALMVNNYDWMKGIGFLDFIRDIGKLITRCV